MGCESPFYPFCHETLIIYNLYFLDHAGLVEIQFTNFYVNFYFTTFQVKSKLTEHLKAHSDARTFLCGFCGKALKNRQCLNRYCEKDYDDDTNGCFS